LMTPNRLSENSDKMASSRGRGTSPPNRAGTILVARNGSSPLPGKVPVRNARWLGRGWIKGPPYARRFSPIRGVPTVGKVYDLCYREGSAKHLGIGVPHAIAARPLGKAARREPKQADVDQDTLGFCAVD